MLPEGVQIVNASGAFGIMTAEIAVTGLLAMQRRLPEILTANERQEWAPAACGRCWT